MELNVKMLKEEESLLLTPEETEVARQIFERVKAMEVRSSAHKSEVERALRNELCLVGLDILPESLSVGISYTSYERDGHTYE